MKITIIPAQVTTVEDKIIGKLGMSQLILLVLPLFAACAIYIAIPPFMHTTSYKLVMMLVILIISGILAIRIKSKLLLFWLILFMKYANRPRYYIFNKNSEYERDTPRKMPIVIGTSKDTEAVSKMISSTQILSIAEISDALQQLNNPSLNMRFEFNKKGILHGLITEAKK